MREYSTIEESIYKNTNKEVHVRLAASGLVHKRSLCKVLFFLFLTG